MGVFVVYIDTGSPMLNIPSKSRDLADENNKILTEWKWIETTVLDDNDPCFVVNIYDYDMLTLSQ
jgi:hypothetical protein